MREFKQSDFKPILNHSFHVSIENGKTVALVLKDVSEVKDMGRSHSFSLEFHGPKTLFLKQRSYTLTHEALGAKHIFLVPVDECDDHYKYQAVFNINKH